MPSLDIFNDDAFSMASLTRAINEQPHVPGMIGAHGLFTEEGVTTTAVTVEKDGDTLALVAAGERGSVAANVAGSKRKLVTFNTIHLPQRATILADEIQNVRAFGSETDLETIQNVVNKRLAKMRRNLDATVEFQRIGAIKGALLDSDGVTELVDIYDTFGLTQDSVGMALGTDGTNVRGKVITAVRTSEDALGNTTATGYRAYCGDAFFDAFIDHPKVKAAYERWLEGEFLRNDPRAGFLFGGVFWVNYRGKVGSTKFVGDDDAYLVPEGVPDLFATHYAPADYVEAANTIGLPYYSKQEAKEMGKGVLLEAQSNPISLCTRPKAIIKLTKV
ncbi:conserved hypothetical protein [Aromatoleum aromaticum EbN1]|uniref:Elements of external origin n=1 Tax=Aromatoleum aromaticum (strain DSM 19018 / LMG 30748 / EbN1) TaxID=76114 RepID=Q5NXH8_AROAE|nr:major capsid protein [Aromatoleum aromaticum]CAI10236.1 conserved hypothetical protein [Aromatoleum aromaticum EbN1]